MAITPADIEQLTFSPSKHGYDTEEVDTFLEQLTGEVSAMLQKIADLKQRLNASEQQLATTQAQLASAQEQVMAPMTVSVPSATSASESQISKVLIVAQQSADQIVAEARESADKIRTDADTKAREVIRQALAEKQNELDEIDRLKASREEFRSEYKSLLQHFMDDADAAFPSQVLTSPNGSASSRGAVVPVSAPAAGDGTAPQPVVPEQPSVPAITIDDLD